jgi:catechol 2,3-dioxygenase
MTSSLQLRSLQLRVSDLARSLDFYVRQVGFVVAKQTAQQAGLTVPGRPPTDEPLLVLTEDRSAPPASPAAAGLFHAALLLPTRAALGRWLQTARAAGVEFAGFSDHGVSEAIYFSDPDGNGLEFYVDRPPELWPQENGGLAMGTLPLDLPSLLAAGASSPAMGPVLHGAAWGHFHFRVTNLDRSEKFYSEALGVTLTQRYGSSARFLGADGYHHHIGLNTWGQPRLPHSAGALGLVEVSFARAPQEKSLSFHDPDGIILRLTGIP